MSRLPDSFHEDRALRDAARKVLLADLAHARATLTGKAVAGRVVGRIGDGAKDVFGIAKSHAVENRGILAGLIALVALWFARRPLLELLGLDARQENEIETADPASAQPDPQPETTGECDE